MSASSRFGTAKSGTRGTQVPWGDVVLSAIASVSWALIGMAGTAALGLHLLEADASGSLGPMTAAVVALGAGGSVTPSGDVSAFGLKGAEAHTAVTITPLGVSLVGALLLSWFFLRSLRAAGVVIAPAELLARAGAVVTLFVATLGGLAWAGHDVITIDGARWAWTSCPAVAEVEAGAASTSRVWATSVTSVGCCRTTSATSSTRRPRSASPSTRRPRCSAGSAGRPASC